MVDVYVDESGNSGFFDPKQPVFALSALVISDADAEKVKELLPQRLLQGDELKHENLSKAHRKKVRDGLVEVQRELLTKHPALVYVIEHRFCLIQKLLMDCIPGNDPRVFWIQQMALDIYGEYDDLVRSCGIDQILMAYDELSSTASDGPDFLNDLTAFQEQLLLAASKSEVLDMALGDFARGDANCVEEFVASCGKLNLHNSLIFGLLTELFKVVHDDMRLVFDESPQFGLMKAAWERPILRQVKDVISCSSHISLGIQLADILAGGARLVGERKFSSNVVRRKEAAYCDALEKIYDDNDVMLFQPPYRPVPTFARVPELLAQTVS